MNWLSRDIHNLSIFNFNQFSDDPVQPPPQSHSLRRSLFRTPSSFFRRNIRLESRYISFFERNNVPETKRKRSLKEYKINRIFHRKSFRCKNPEVSTWEETSFEIKPQEPTSIIKINDEIKENSSNILSELQIISDPTTLILDPPSSDDSSSSELKLLNGALSKFKMPHIHDKRYTSSDRMNQRPFESMLPYKIYPDYKKVVRRTYAPFYQRENKIYHNMDNSINNKEFLYNFKKRLVSIQIENAPLSRSTNL